ncbi:hypothetical protein [Mesorhizobium loti]|uniref:hypothetical protein n=1 Tax=Rhizobium loti TaxID=381 RepID=UPI0012690112|nr:hypothetical protein [Mesorhizobium loti]
MNPEPIRAPTIVKGTDGTMAIRRASSIPPHRTMATSLVVGFYEHCRHRVPTPPSVANVFARKVAFAFAVVTVVMSPAFADSYADGCIYYQSNAPDNLFPELQFILGGDKSSVTINERAGELPRRCAYSIRTTPFLIKCGKHTPEPFAFAGPTIDKKTHDILIFRNAAWYRVCYTPS